VDRQSAQVLITSFILTTEIVMATFLLDFDLKVGRTIIWPVLGGKD
jgi:hypothetical protein